MKKGRKKTSIYVDGEIVKDFLEYFSINQAQLAKKINYSRENVCRSINKNKMDKEMLEAISITFDVDENYFIGETQNIKDQFLSLDPEIKDGQLKIRFDQINEYGEYETVWLALNEYIDFWISRGVRIDKKGRIINHRIFREALNYAKKEHEEKEELLKKYLFNRLHLIDLDGSLVNKDEIDYFLKTWFPKNSDSFIYMIEQSIDKIFEENFIKNNHSDLPRIFEI